MEPNFIAYNRRIGQSVYVFWLVEPGDLGALMGLVSLNFALFESYYLFLWMVLLFFLYIIAFRPGRPRGYDRHYFASMMTSRYLRPGRADRKAYIRERAPLGAIVP